jgi:hypothetical protein
LGVQSPITRDLPFLRESHLSRVRENCEDKALYPGDL